MKQSKQVVLITGCSSGIGAALSREFYKKNCHVIATARRIESLEKLRKEGLDIERLDINNHDEIERVVAAIMKNQGRIDLLINNAGYALIGPTIELTASQLQSQLETNVLSPLALIRVVAPGMKNNGKGKIVNIGSISGVVSTPFSGAYCSSKAALHSLSDALRMELSPFGIKVITVQPGAIKSHFGKAASKTARDIFIPDSWYESVQKEIIGRAELSQLNATPANIFAEHLVNILLKENPPPIIRLGKKSWFLPAMKQLLPTAVLDKIFIKKFGIDLLKKSASNMEK